MEVINFNNYRKNPLELGGALPKLAIWYDDNGNSMSSLLSEKKMKKALKLNDEEFIKQFIIDTPISQIKLNKERKSFYYIFRKYDFKKYIVEIAKNLRKEDIGNLFNTDSVLKEFYSDVELEFFIRYLEKRYEYFVGGKIYE